jgi:hypothetical protein
MASSSGTRLQAGLSCGSTRRILTLFRFFHHLHDTTSYKGGQTEIEIRPGVTVTVIEVAGRDALKPGTKITLIARKNSDGTLTPRFIRIAA